MSDPLGYDTLLEITGRAAIAVILPMQDSGTMYAHMVPELRHLAVAVTVAPAAARATITATTAAACLHNRIKGGVIRRKTVSIRTHCALLSFFGFTGYICILFQDILHKKFCQPIIGSFLQHIQLSSTTVMNTLQTVY